MENDTNYKQREIITHEKQIDIRQLFFLLWKKKIFILIITITCAALAGVFSEFIISPVYQSSMRITINMPEIYKFTKYGEYILPIATNRQFIDMINDNKVLQDTLDDMGEDYEDVSLEKLSRAITILGDASDNNLNYYEIKVMAKTPQQAQKLAEILYNNYYERVDFFLLEGVVQYFQSYYPVLIDDCINYIEIEKRIMMENEKLLVKTPKTLDVTEALKQTNTQSDSQNVIVLDNIINPNYTKLETDILLSKQSITNWENKISLYEKYIDELELIHKEIDEYNENDSFDLATADQLRIAKNYLSLSSAPFEPREKISPSNLMNIVIGAFLGGVISLLIVFLKEWISNGTAIIYREKTFTIREE